MSINTIYRGPARYADGHSGVSAGRRAAAAARPDAAQHFRAALSRNGRRCAARRPSHDRHDPARSRASRLAEPAQLFIASAAPAASRSSPRPATAAICCSSPGLRASTSRRNSRSSPAIASAASAFAPFADDFVARKGEDEVDRDALLACADGFSQGAPSQADWDGIEKAPNEALVNALAMMAPFGAAEKQALLEAPDLKTRAEILVAATEIELAKTQDRRRRNEIAIGACMNLLVRHQRQRRKHRKRSAS